MSKPMTDQIVDEAVDEAFTQAMRQYPHTRYDDRNSKHNGAAAEQQAPAPDIRPLTAAEFLQRKLVPRERIIAPWLPEKGLVMVYSPRGVGKTLFGMTSAYAIAAGADFLKFSTAEKARKILYIDGEMPAETMQERLAAIVGGFAQQPPADDYFRILISDLSEVGLPDLATVAGQTWIDAQVGDAKVIFVDNLSTLVRSGKENEAEAWLPLQNWALRHRRAGLRKCAVVSTCAVVGPPPSSMLSI
jgi:hypothetical protein